MPAIHRVHSAEASSGPPTNPALLYSLPQLEESLKAAYKLVTEGKFTDALKVRIRGLMGDHHTAYCAGHDGTD